VLRDSLYFFWLRKNHSRQTKFKYTAKTLSRLHRLVLKKQIFTRNSFKLRFLAQTWLRLAYEVLPFPLKAKVRSIFLGVGTKHIHYRLRKKLLTVTRTNLHLPAKECIR